MFVVVVVFVDDRTFHLTSQTAFPGVTRTAITWITNTIHTQFTSYTSVTYAVIDV